eukprot:UN30228
MASKRKPKGMYGYSQAYILPHEEVNMTYNEFVNIHKQKHDYRKRLKNDSKPVELSPEPDTWETFRISDMTQEQNLFIDFVLIFLYVKNLLVTLLVHL